MPKVIRIDRKLRRVGRKLVTDAGGAPCCCGGGLFYKLKACACSGGFNNRWTKLYDPSMGCVWANLEGKCYTICPDAQSKATLGFGDVEVSPTLNPVATEEDGCAACCGTPAQTCCEWGGSCGLTTTQFPFSQIGWDLRLNSTYAEGNCGDCGRWSWNRFDGAIWTGSRDSDGECTGGASDNDTTFSVAINPCTNSMVDYEEDRKFEAYYDLIPGRTIDAGSAADDRKVIGPTPSVPTPALYISYQFSSGMLPSVSGAEFIIEAAVSLADPSKWWLAATGKAWVGSGSAMTLTGGVLTPGSCAGRIEASFSVVQSLNTAVCGGTQLVQSASGTLVGTMSNLGTCAGARPSGSDVPPGALLDPAVARTLDLQARGGGCRGCSG